ncbi:hypothetical protein [Pseudomonas sp. R32]|uniref:hypothetical protein n=1 Tax=Pseudomonas sp. R32 TaxID=1573704 RepID=UPI00132E7B28|nr:hypothetical protein [Pseudomonas sp. R32]QHF27382.1 hypothetical protein PspR32_06035 [Pseudomonas sp. R32]
MSEQQMADLLTALQQQTSVMTLMSQTMERLALSSEQLVTHFKSLEPDPSAPLYLDGTSAA